MGLWVSVFKDIKETTNVDEYDFIAYVIDENWKYKIKNLKEDGYYEGKRTGSEVNYSYSTHNRFREHLLQIIGRNDLLLKDGKIDWVQLEKETEIPFYELINFADNEGCLDFEISNILYKNFIEWRDKAIKYFEKDDYFASKYLDWVNVFKDGKETNNVVVFS